MSSFCTAKIQHICVSLDVNFNESLTNDIVSFEQLGPERYKAAVLVLFVICVALLPFFGLRPVYCLQRLLLFPLLCVGYVM